MWESVEEIRRRKAELRREALARRAQQPDKDRLSFLICQKLLALPEFQAARTVLFYVHYGDEVRTQPLLRYLLGETDSFNQEQPQPDQSPPSECFGVQNIQPGNQNLPPVGTPPPDNLDKTAPGQSTGRLLPDRQLLVPYCEGEDLRLFWLQAMAELQPGVFGILEPRRPLRQLPERQATIHQVDLVVVPGVAFDPRCARLGHGRGYYDHLLAQARPETVLVGLAYQCQILPEVPMLATDIPMDKVITEAAVYRRNPSP
jgi:5-formyltetrahydrofolate cyclo-ligase